MCPQASGLLGVFPFNPNHGPQEQRKKQPKNRIGLIQRNGIKLHSNTPSATHALIIMANPIIVVALATKGNRWAANVRHLRDIKLV
jgi:hypothetical protein